MKKILILASNPKGDLRIDREIRDLKKAVERSSQQEQFDVEIQLAVTPDSLEGLFHQYKPNIVHFCGHGTGEKGLVFENNAGEEQLVSTQAIAHLFEFFANQIECVLLNACYTEIQANAIVKHIQYVIGTNRAILDEAAYWFAVGFYQGLGYGELIERCYELGRIAIELQIPNITFRSRIDKKCRKLEVIGENHFPVTEPLKIVLKKNSFLLSSTSENIPSNFKQAINNAGKLKHIVVTLGNNIELNIIRIPEGTFQMGSNEKIEEQPVHEVSIKPFWIGKYLITQQQWQAVAKLPQVEIDLNPIPSRFIGNNYPVERVNWYEAKEFCARLSKFTNHQYRLPSEAEWEYACRAGSTTSFNFGETINTDRANYNGNYVYANESKGKYLETTTPVNQFSANDFELCDMHGNLWEWCEDAWHPNYKQAPTDGSVWQEGSNPIFRVVRGGAWNSQPKKCRCAYRNYIEPDIKWNIVGFRIVKSD